MNIVSKRWLNVMVVLALLVAMAIPMLFASNANATETFKKVFVCKYVGKPGVDEVLQTGQNPINTSINSIKNYPGVGGYFNDAQGRSLVVAEDKGQPEPSCPVTDKKVVPKAPVFIDADCENEKGIYTIQTTTGVTYKVGNTIVTGINYAAVGTSVTVKAYANEGYVLDGTSEWMHVFVNSEENCGGGNEPEYFLAISKVWVGDSFDKTNVKVAFTIDGKEWNLGDDPVEVDRGEPVTITEKVTGMPENCTYVSDLKSPYVPKFDEAYSAQARLLLNMENDDEPTFLDTLKVTNTVDCAEPGRGGETPTTVTPVSTTPTQVSTVPVGAADTGAGNVAGIVGVISSIGLLTAGFVSRKFTV